MIAPLHRCLPLGLAVLALTLAAPSAQAAKYSEAEVAELVEIAQSEKAQEGRRAAAARELARTDVRTHLSVLRKLLREERSPDIRLAAACSLAALGDHKSPKDLLFVTAYDGIRTATVSRCDVLTALGQLGEPAAFFHLERALKAEPPTDEPLYHAEACRALRKLDTPEADLLLITSTTGGSVPVRTACIGPVAEIARNAKHPLRTQAVNAIHQSARADAEEKVAELAMAAILWEGAGTPAFFPLLEQDANPRVRARAARAMNRHYLSAPRLARLKAAAQKERDPEVRRAIQETLEGQKSGTQDK